MKYIRIKKDNETITLDINNLDCVCVFIGLDEKEKVIYSQPDKKTAYLVDDNNQLIKELDYKDDIYEMILSYLGKNSKMLLHLSFKGKQLI